MKEEVWIKIHGRIGTNVPADKANEWYETFTKEEEEEFFKLLGEKCGDRLLNILDNFMRKKYNQRMLWQEIENSIENIEDFIK